MDILTLELFGAWWPVTTLFLIDLAVRIWLVFYIPRNRKPTAATAWLLLIYIIPIFGTLLFFIIGNTKLSKNRLANQRHVTKLIKDYSNYLHDNGYTSDLTGTLAEAPSKLAESLTGFATTKGNSIEVMSGYQSIIDDMIDSVNNAKDFVYVEFYAIALDNTTRPFFDALEAAVKRGVAVYVLFDFFGSRGYPDYKGMKAHLTSIGVRWRVILPLQFTPRTYTRPDLRNHRKIVVIDTNISYIGSLNLIDKTYHRKDDISYIELVAKVSGPATLELAGVFIGDWHAESGEILTHINDVTSIPTPGTISAQIIPSGPGYTYENNLKYFVSLIAHAKKSVVITNPYLVPDEALLNALISAALRGVNVSVLNSEAMDQWMVGHAQRSYYEQLLQAGLKISLYKKPQLVHEKYMVIDNEIAVIGSSNLDRRSFELNLECTMAVYDSKTAQQLVDHHEELKKHSYTLTLKAWKRRGLWASTLDGLARLTSALQ